MLVSLASDVDDPVGRASTRWWESSRVAKEPRTLHRSAASSVTWRSSPVPALDDTRLARALGRDACLRPGPATGERHGVEHPGTRSPALPAPGAGEGRSIRSGRSPRVSAST